MLTRVKHIHGLTSIKRERVLPVAGNVLVRRMQKVSPNDVIVVAPLSPRYILLDISQGLNVNADRADEVLQRQAGDELVKGDVIAGPVGIFQRVVRAPDPGTVRIAGEGKVLFETATPAFELQAGMEGTVTNVIPDRGAIIETRGAVIQGVWGNGKIAFGVGQPVSNELLQELVPEQLNISFRGLIITAGFCTKPEALEAAASVPVKGLILGSLSSSLLPLARSMDYPIMVIDGFGSQPMNKTAEGILLANREKNYALNAQEVNAFQGKHPEVIITTTAPAEVEPPPEAEMLRPGKRVIIINGPLAPTIGRIQGIPAGRQPLPNGLLARVAEISYGADKKALIPLENLELIRE